MSTALARNEQVKSLVFANQAQHKAMLPPDQQAQVTGWLSSAYAALSKDPNLAQAAMTAPETFINAMNDAAQHGLRPGTTEYYLTPRKNKGRVEVLGIIGYQGHIEQMYRSGKVRSVIVEAVHENDSFSWNPGEMEKPSFLPAGGGDGTSWFAGKKDRGDLVGAFAYAIMADGGISNVVIVDADRIAAAKDASAGSHSQYSPWQKHPKSMYLKTAAHDLAKWVPTSAVDLREKAQATVGSQAAVANMNHAGQVLASHSEPEPQEVLEPEFVEEIKAEEGPEQGTGELAAESQLNEIRKRYAKQGYENDGQIASDLEAAFNQQGLNMQTLTREQADQVLANLAA